MSFRVIVTVGPSLLANDGVLRAIDRLGDCVYRINGAHVPPRSLRSFVASVREQIADGTVMLDLPGNKVRAANLGGVLEFRRGNTYRIRGDQLNFPSALTMAVPGDRIVADSGNLILEVIAAVGGDVEVVARSDGTLSKNKGLHITGTAQRLPFVSERDSALIEEGAAAGIDCLSLSYVRDAQDIRQVRALVDSGIEIFAKIETASALEHLPEIISAVGVLNIDRGDLASEIGIMRLGGAIDRVIAEVRRANKQIFLATQFLGAMERSPTPLIPEILDLERTLRMGVNGIQLSEETAIGRYPAECVQLVFDVHRQVTQPSA